MCSNWFPTVLYVHTRTQQRASMKRVFHLCFPDLLIILSTFIMGHFLVYGSYEGQVWLKGIAPFFGTGSKPLEVSCGYTSHSSLMNVCSFPISIKVNSFSYPQQNRLHPFMYAVFIMKSYTCVIMYMRSSAAALLPHCLLVPQSTNCIYYAFPSFSWISLLAYRLFSAILSFHSIALLCDC